MKNSKRILAVLLTVVMAMGCFAGFTFTSAAESIDLTAQSYITMGNGGNVTELLTNGNTGDYCDLGFWTNDNVSNPPFGTEGKCYIQIDLGTLCTVDSVWAVNLGGRNYKWDIYYSDDVSKDISTWTKVDGKTNDDTCTTEGYTVEFGTPITAKYIRLYGMYNSANIGYHFCEVKVMGAMVDPNAELEFDGIVKEPTETVEITLGPSAFGQWENWGSKTNALTGLTAGEGGAYNSMIMDGLISGTYTAKVTLTDETADKTFIIPKYFFDNTGHEIYNATPHFFRFVFAEYNIPLVVGNAYTIAMEVYKGDKLLFKGATPEGQFSDWTKATEILVPETVPHDYLEPGEEPPAPTVPELTIKPYTYAAIKGFENWPASDKQTNMLVQAPKAPGDFRNNTWVLTINGEEYEMTVASVGALGDNYIYRFQVCLADKPFIPVVGTEYTVSAEIFDGETLVATTTESAGFIPHEEPIVPEPPVEPEGPTAITIAPKFGKWENWVNSPNNPDGMGAEPGVTQLLVGITAGGAKIDIPAELTWVLTIKGGDQDKTITMSPATKALDYDLYRFETCLGEGENQFIPVNGVDYTVTIKVYDGETLAYESEAVSGFICPMDPVVPETVEPEPPVEPEGPVDIEINPYEAGDIKGFENWSGQTQLLIRVDGNNTVDYSGYTWKITIADDETAKTITLVPSSAQEPWLYRFETCVAEGDNQFIPVNGTEYTISVEILNEAGEVIAQSGRRNGFIPFQEPIVPEPPVEPEPPQTGDAAIYATIAVAVAAVALAVVFKKRATI